MSNPMKVQLMVSWLSDKVHFNERELKSIIKNNSDVMRQVFKVESVRRSVKKAMKELIERRSFEELNHPDLVNWWVRCDDDGTAHDYCWIIKGDADNAKRVLNKLGEPWEGVEIRSAYDCTGQWFRWEANFTQLSDRTFVTQSARMDV